MKHTIEIEGLPEGYEVNKIQVTEKQPWENGTIAALIHVKKKQPRRIVLEETATVRYPRKGDYYFYRGCLRRWSKENECDHEHAIWRIVKESDLSLNNEDHKLSLSVDECRNMSLSEINIKIVDFLKDK